MAQIDIAAIAAMNLPPKAVVVESASFTLTLAHASQIVEVNSASAVSVTVPPDSSLNFPVGYPVDIVAAGTGVVTITPGSGVTIRSAGGLSAVDGQWSAVTLYRRAANEWVLIGALA